MGVPSRTSAPTPALDQTSDIQIILGKVRPLSRPLTEAHPQVLIIALARLASAIAVPSLLVLSLTLAACGAALQTFVICSTTWFQERCEPQWRGRVMGIYMLVFMGGKPIGSPVLGNIVEELDGQWALYISGSILALGTLAVYPLIHRSKLTTS